MSALTGQIGEVQMTIQITRKETGKVEEFKLTGFLDQEKLKEIEDGRPTDRRLGDNPDC
jgi:hypothetical protein